MSSSKKSSGGDSSSASWDSNKNIMDEKHFLRMYSKALAEALRTKEEEEAAEREELKQQKRSRNKSSLTDVEETKITAAYRELCHDDPIVTGGDRICRLLAEVLIPTYKTKRSIKNDKSSTLKLALSSPLVEGVSQAIARASSRAATSLAKQTKNNTLDDASRNTEETTKSPPTEESMIGSSSITSSEGYAQLAFAIFLEGPYRCIQQDNLDVTSQFLGSFQPPEKTKSAPHEGLSAEEKSRLVDEATAKIVDGMEKMSMEEDQTKSAQNERDDDASSSSSEFFLHNNKNNIQLHTDYDSMEEVWAEESDPDDYEYESSYNPYTAASNTDDDNFDSMDGDYFNPMQLSEPNSANKTWDGARNAIYHLLSRFSYGNMALNTLPSRTWSDLGMSESLGDLAFTLLLANTDDSSDSNSLLWHENTNSESADDNITSLWDRALFALRDRAMDSNHGHDALTVYLQLLCAFLSHSEEDIMSILSSPAKDTSNTNDLPPLTAVGLSSFATLCSSKEMTSSSATKLSGTSIESVCPRDEVYNAIFNSIDTLAHIIECVRPKKTVFGVGKLSDDVSTPNSWVRTAVCIIPMIEYLINIKARFDFQTVFEEGGTRSMTLSDSDAKALLDSGLFRELLSLYTSTQGEIGASNVVRLQLLRTIFALSVQSPEILGRYAIRVPDLVKEVHANNFIGENLVDGILWTALGSSLLESKLEAPKPRLKLRANAKLNLPSVDTSKLAERSCEGFEKLCKSCNSALVSYKEIAANEHQSEDTEKEVRQHKEMLGDIVKFSNYLSHCPHGIKIWLDSLNNHEDAPQKVKVAIADLRSTLARLPSYAEERGVKGSGHKKDDDNDNLGTDDHSEIRQKAATLRQRRKDFRQVVSLVRSSVKVIALALDSQKGAGLSLKTPTLSYNASSKTD